LKKILIIFALLLHKLSGHQNSFGVATIYTQKPYIGDTSKQIYVPVINFEQSGFFVKGLEIGYKFGYVLTLLFQPRLNSVEIEGVPEKGYSLDFGFKTGYRFSNGLLFELKYLHDVLSVYNGYMVSSKFSKLFIGKSTVFIPFAGVDFMDENLAQYYYGIEGSSRFPDYRLNSSLNPFLGMVFVYNINRDYAVTLINKTSFLNDEIKNSPIVERDIQSFYLLSFVRKF
jgi:outer membrane scaffolding protein for murein synthesis (MipA/OmpV family)